MKNRTISKRELQITLSRVSEHFKEQRFPSPSKAWLRWAIDLTRKDLDLLSEGDWLNLENEVVVFGYLTLRPSSPPGEKTDFPEGIKLHTPSKQDITKLKTTLQERLDEYGSRKSKQQYGPFKVTITLSVRNDGNIAQWVKGSFIERSLCSLALLLGEHGGMIRFCEECGVMFLAYMSDQKYHDTKCLNRVTQRRMREKQEKGQ